MIYKRRTVESPLIQGENEQIIFSLTTTPWGSSPSSISVTLKSYPDMTDVTSHCLNGSASVAGDVITLPILQSLTAGIKYRLAIKFTCSGNVFETWADITGEI